MASKMNSQSLYKKRAPGLASRDVRAKLKSQESKAKRDDLLASRRRIPLSVIQEEEKKGPSKLKKQLLTKEQQSEQRLEKLREWKKARDALKKKENQAKKPFLPTAAKASKASHNIFINPKPWVGSSSLSDKQQKPAAVKPATVKSKPAKSATVVKPSRPKTQPTKSNAPPTKSSTSASKTTIKPATVKVPKKQPLKTKPEASKDVKSRPQTRSMTKSAVSKVKAESKSSCSTKITARKASKQKSVPSRTVTTRSSGTTKVTTQNTAEMMDISIEIPNHPPPVTPTKNGRYDPVNPSPLLRCQSASLKRREVQLFGPPPVNDPTWLPGQTNKTPFIQPDFDEAFTNFSPFKFGDSDSTFQFTFHKEYSSIPEEIKYNSIPEDSLDSDSLQRLPTPDAALIRKSLGTEDKEESVKRRSVCVDDDNAMIIEVVTEALPTEVTRPHIDVEYFRRLHSEVVASLTSLCTVWEEKEEALQKQLSEEVLGQIRTTVGQGRLLIKQKLKQYLGLVATAENQSGERETTSEDLQGFWDMVYFQVEDVYKKFSLLDSMEQNSWTMKAPTPKKRKVSKKRGGAVKSNSTEESERAVIARQKREAQRNKLKELKMAAAKRAREEATAAIVVDNEPENILHTPPKKTRVDELILRNGGSAYKNGRRRSIRLKNVSVFSPAPGTPHNEDISHIDVPIASLILFD